MNRRSYFKSLFILGGAGVASFTVFKYFKINEPFDVNLLHSKINIIAELAELIIPRTETPGARDAGVPEFIIAVILNCNSVRQQKQFLSGLEDLENYCNSHYNSAFLECDGQKKKNILLHFSKNSVFQNKLIYKINKKIFGESFYTKLRSLVVEGYCCSEIGATRGLAYDYIPHTYEACIPLRTNQKSWATK